jgi:3-isopropylmalate dehydrogenase
MLLAESFGLASIATALVGAVNDVLAAGWRTPDIMAPGCRAVGTRELAAHVGAALQRRLDALPVAAGASSRSPATAAAGER